MKSAWKFLWKSAKTGSSAVFSVGLWTSWLALVGILAVQVFWLTSRELAVPGYVLRALESRVAASGLAITFGHTAFDPSGRILIEDIKLRAPAFPEPLLTLKSAYLRLNPLDLAVGKFEPLEIRVSGLTGNVPAMMSASGRVEPILRDVDATLIPSEKELTVSQLTARLGTLDISVHGSVILTAWPPRKGAAFPFTDYLVNEYPRLSRRMADYMVRLEALDSPRLDVTLDPSETAGAIVLTSVFAREFRVTDPLVARASGLIATTAFPLRTSGVIALRIDASAEEIGLPQDAKAEGLQAFVNGSLDTASWKVTPGSARLSVRSASGFGLATGPVGIDATLAGDRTKAAILTRLEGTAISATADVDIGRGTGRVDFETRPGSELVAAVAKFINRPIEDTVKIGPAPRVRGSVELDPGWKLGVVDGWIDVQDVRAKGVDIDTASGHVRLAGTSIATSDIDMRFGTNWARGSYTMDSASREYRFLVTGKVQPMELAPWFKEWWPRFFGRFEFDGAGINTDVDVQGRWGSPYLSTVWVAADAGANKIRDVPFDSLRTRMFIRPEFYDSLDFLLTRGPGYARGTFTRSVDGGVEGFRYMDFAVDSTIDEQSTARIFGEQGTDIVAPFRFATPPKLRVTGHIDGAAAKGGEHRLIHVEGESEGGFQLYEFPLSDPKFKAEIRDDDIVVDPISVRIAMGTATGRAHLTGRTPDKQLEFNLAIVDARLGPAAEVVSNYVAKRNGTAAQPRSAFVEKAADSRLDISATARGSASDFYSYHGTGQLELNGPQVGEVEVLGGLSRLFNATLRFTKLQSPISIDGKKLVFPNLVLTGANSLAEAKGAYGLDDKGLDFLVNVSPWGKSQSLASVLDFVLKPITSTLEVQLSGTIDEPKYGLTVGGPNDTLKALLESSAATTPADSSPRPTTTTP